MPRIGIFTGTFDPITLGHVSVIERSQAVVDELIVGIGVNVAKSPLFSAEERIALVEQSVAHLDFVKVTTYSGLAVDFVRAQGGQVILRGIRPWSSELEGEIKMATANRHLADSIETVFLLAEQHLWSVSSTLVRELAYHGASEETLGQFVPSAVAAALGSRTDRA